MTLQQLESRLSDLERQVIELQQAANQPRPLVSAQDTFGAFANDEEFDEIVRLGREYRKQANAEDHGC
jgi:hypothetical protein